MTLDEIKQMYITNFGVISSDQFKKWIEYYDRMSLKTLLIHIGPNNNSAYKCFAELPKYILRENIRSGSEDIPEEDRLKILLEIGDLI